MPDAHGIEAVSEMKRDYPDVKILAISLHRENEFKYRCRNAGAAGYVVKDAIYDELLDAMRTVLGGNTYFGAHAPELAFSDYVNGSAPTGHSHIPWIGRPLQRTRRSRHVGVTWA